jgi:cytochrome c-type biogenesis protein CcmH
MIGDFWLIATVLTAVAVGSVLIPLWRRRPPTQLSQNAADTAIFQERLAELTDERQQGRLDENRYRELCAELERNLLADVPEHPPSTTAPAPAGVKAAVVTGVLVPALALSGYYFGAYRGEARRWLAAQNEMAPLVTQALTDPNILMQHPNLDLLDFTRVLQARLLKDGLQDANGLYLLGLGYLDLQQLPLALPALALAHERAPDRPDIMLAYGQALLFAHQGRLTEDSARLLERVLTLDPHQQRALFLYGLGAFNAGRYEDAIRSWKSLLALRNEPGSEGARVLEQSIARAETLLAEQKPAPAAVDRGPQLAVTVELAPDLRNRVADGATLFVFARSAAGPSMPLVAVRQPASHFPVEVVLDDGQALNPALKLSTFKQVIVSARISHAGTVTAQPGDLQGISGTLDVVEGRQAVMVMIKDIVQ